jgi:16S rRNA (cytosine967-C5)-methyltransferase
MTNETPPGLATRRAAMKLLDAVLRRGLPLEGAMDAATAELDRADDRAFAHAIAAEALRRLPDLDRLIDSATQKKLPHDAKARFALRIALVQALALGTPAHAAISTVLPLMDGGPRRLVHGVFGALMRDEPRLDDPPNLPPPVSKRWRKAWGEAAVAGARRAIASPRPLDLTLRDPGATAAWAERLGGISLALGHVRLAAGARVARQRIARNAEQLQRIAPTQPHTVQRSPPGEHVQARAKASARWTFAPRRAARQCNWRRLAGG